MYGLNLDDYRRLQVGEIILATDFVVRHSLSSSGPPSERIVGSTWSTLHFPMYRKNRTKKGNKCLT